MNPCCPAEAQAMVLPCASAIVIFVLLNVAFTCATAEEMFLRSRRLTRVVPFTMMLPLHAHFPVE